MIALYGYAGDYTEGIVTFYKLFPDGVFHENVSGGTHFWSVANEWFTKGRILAELLAANGQNEEAFEICRRAYRHSFRNSELPTHAVVYFMANICKTSEGVKKISQEALSYYPPQRFSRAFQELLEDNGSVKSLRDGVEGEGHGETDDCLNPRERFRHFKIGAKPPFEKTLGSWLLSEGKLTYIETYEKQADLHGLVLPQYDCAGNDCDGLIEWMSGILDEISNDDTKYGRWSRDAITK